MVQRQHQASVKMEAVQSRIAPPLAHACVDLVYVVHSHTSFQNHDMVKWRESTSLILLMVHHGDGFSITEYPGELCSTLDAHSRPTVRCRTRTKNYVNPAYRATADLGRCESDTVGHLTV